MTSNPGSDIRPQLHPRLTVARAVGGSHDLDATVIGRETVAAEAHGLAVERLPARAAVRARLDAAAARAVHDLETANADAAELRSGRQGLLDVADWAVDADRALPNLAAAIESARAVFEMRRADQRSARARLDQVLEQRSAAAAAMQDADSQVGDLDGLGMDENGLRRELEAAGGAARAAHEAHVAAVAEVQRLTDAHDAADRRAAQLHEQLAAHGPLAACSTADLDRVRAALRAWTRAARAGGVDNYSQALADAFGELLADLEQQEAITGARPDAAALTEGRDELARAASELRRIEAAAGTPTLTEVDRAELDAAHAAVGAAAERSDRRIGRASALRRLDGAVAAERVLLDRFGFDSYLEVVLTGGRTASITPERLAAESAYLTARANLDRLQVALHGSPELDHLHSERTRLLAHIADRLGVDPGTEVIALLRAHPMLPGSVVDDLRQALVDVAVFPVGVGLAAAAERWLDEQAATVEAKRLQEVEVARLETELDDVLDRGASLLRDLALAREAEARAVEQLELATRSVGAVEAELTTRAGEDVTRFQRYVAAQQLRTQIEALTATLAHAEQEAGSVFDGAMKAAEDAERALDRAQSGLEDIARRARALADDLPPDRRPIGDRLTTLVALAHLLRERASDLCPGIDAAEAAVVVANARVDAAFAAAEQEGAGLDGPRTEDVLDGFERLLGRHANCTVVLDEPFGGLEPGLLEPLLATVLRHDGPGPLVLLTDDPEILGWAIGLPAGGAAVVSTDSVLNLIAKSADTKTTEVEVAAPASTLPAGLAAGQR